MALAFIGGVLAATRIPQELADEQYYGPQIEAFMAGRFALRPGITMIPGYHAAVALIASIFGGYSGRLARVVSGAISLAFVPLAWKLARAAARDAPVRTAQSFLLPLLFPYFFLIYTEGWSLCLLALMLVAVLERRYALSAVAILLGCVIRQDFIVWTAVAVGISAQLAWEQDPSTWRERLRPWVRSIWPLWVPVAAFAAFVAWNRGIALGDRAMHSPGTIQVTNAYFVLLCAWFVFLPVHLPDARAVFRLAASPRGVAVFALGFIVYILTFSNAHPYNQPNLRFFLHNEALYWMTHSTLVRILCFVPIAYAGAWLTILVRRERRLLVPVILGVASVVMHPLIEQRYYLPVFFMVNTFRPPAPPRAEDAQIAFEALLNVALMWGIVHVVFFP